MLLERIKKYKLILGSSSTRRKDILEELGFTIEIRRPKIQEIFNKSLSKKKIAEFLAQQKAKKLYNTLNDDEILITADTIVVINKKILKKPNNHDEAYSILKELSGTCHEVITGVCIRNKLIEDIFSVTTKVIFNPLSRKEIKFYINNFGPFDKAGSYGIQEWIGYICVQRIEGCYYNVMGLPASVLYQRLNDFI